MKTLSLVSIAVSAAAISSCQVSAPKPAACMDMPPYHGSAGFERMKSLVGKWKGNTGMGPATTEFRLISGGSVIEERFAEGTPMEMLSTYYDENGKLEMTHYCAIRNRPKMRLTRSSADSITFDFVPSPGINVAKDKHMHGATYTFVDATHFKMEGVAWDQGKSAPCGPPVIFTKL